MKRKSVRVLCIIMMMSFVVMSCCTNVFADSPTTQCSRCQSYNTNSSLLSSSTVTTWDTYSARATGLHCIHGSPELEYTDHWKTTTVEKWSTHCNNCMMNSEVPHTHTSYFTTTRYQYADGC